MQGTSGQKQTLIFDIIVQRSRTEVGLCIKRLLLQFQYSAQEALNRMLNLANVLAVLAIVQWLKLASCAEGEVLENGPNSAFDQWVRNKRTGGNRGNCCKDVRNDLQDQINELAYNLQVLINLGQVKDYPAYSCHQVASWKPGSQSGYYWLQGPPDYKQAYAAHMFCQMDMDIPIFGTTQGWMKIANLDLTEHKYCPEGFELVYYQDRTFCRRSADKGCVSIIFPVHYIEYKRICGRARAYQVGSNNAFHRFECNHCSIDDPYIDGLSFTYGKHPRRHIWSLAASWTEYKDDYRALCPCAKQRGTAPPKFVGNDYFCETGKYLEHKIDLRDPLWDGQGCGKSEKVCCEDPGLPWFCKDLPEPTTEDVEVRVCTDEETDNEDLWVELIQLYVQ